MSGSKFGKVVSENDVKFAMREVSTPFSINVIMIISLSLNAMIMTTKILNDRDDVDTMIFDHDHAM
jgi:hypothetical protein